jgi:penicillin-binding protein 1A
MLPFVYAAAFENGDYPGTLVEDSPLDNRVVMIGGLTGILGEWGPESEDNRYEGAITARQALVRSKDGATVRIGLDTGVDKVVQLCKSAGIRSPLRPYPATFLGSSEVTLAELALGYTTFPNGGWHPGELHILERIEEKDGTIVWDAHRRYGKQTVIKPETAYEVHSCLEEALTSGTGQAAYKQFGLQKIPGIAGKTGTAYDFTDVLFAGYNSSMTCAVWAGFDKPQKIYRGAFSHDIALPIWVDVMNAAIPHYPSRKLPMPATIKKTEICSRSGLLATDKCYDRIKGPNGEIVQKRTTYEEIGTAAQLPDESCNVHGEPRARIVKDTGESEFPRAASAVDLNDVRPVIVRSPAVLVDKDPYNSLRAMIKATPTSVPDQPPDAVTGSIDAPLKAEPVIPGESASPNGQKPSLENGAPVMKAIPVATPQETPLEIRKAQPVGPLDEVKEPTLLNAATPPPTEEPEE